MASSSSSATTSSAASQFLLPTRYTLTDLASFRHAPKSPITALGLLVENSRLTQSSVVHLFPAPCEAAFGSVMVCCGDDGRGFKGNDFKQMLSDDTAGDLTTYGKALATASMRLGKDMLLFTKKDSQWSCLLLSQSAIYGETLTPRGGMPQACAALLTWSVSSKEFVYTGPSDSYTPLLDLFKAYTPYATLDVLLEQFGRISGAQGTAVLVYNLHTQAAKTSLFIESPEPLELEIRPGDFLFGRSPRSDNSHSPQVSFRAFATIMYVNPSIRVYIDSRKVITEHPHTSLYARKRYNVLGIEFREVMDQKRLALLTKRDTKEKHIQELEKQQADILKGNAKSDKQSQPVNTQALLRRLKQDLEGSKQDLEQIEMQVKEHEGKQKQPACLAFVTGMNVLDRRNYGLLVYKMGRLISVFEHVGLHEAGDPWDREGGGGVVAVVDLPEDVMAVSPTHDSFSNSVEWEILRFFAGQAIGQFYLEFCDAHGIGTDADWKGFWSEIGYLVPTTMEKAWELPPTRHPACMQARYAKVQLLAQCSQCMSWRSIGSGHVPEDFACSFDPSGQLSCRNKQDPDKLFPPVSHLRQDICSLLPQLHTGLRDRRNTRLEEARQPLPPPLSLSASECEIRQVSVRLRAKAAAMASSALTSGAAAAAASGVPGSTAAGVRSSVSSSTGDGDRSGNGDDDGSNSVFHDGADGSPPLKRSRSRRSSIAAIDTELFEVEKLRLPEGFLDVPPYRPRLPTLTDSERCSADLMLCLDYMGSSEEDTSTAPHEIRTFRAKCAQVLDDAATAVETAKVEAAEAEASLLQIHSLLARFFVHLNGGTAPSGDMASPETLYDLLCTMEATGRQLPAGWLANM